MSSSERLRTEFLRLLTQDSATHDRKRRDYNQALFDEKEGWAVWDRTDLSMVMEKFDKAVRRVEPRTEAGLTDVPPQALEWARELIRQGYRDEHIVIFTKDGYGLQHPIRCRPNLHGCILNEWLQTQMAPDREPGRYVMEWTDDGPEYRLVPEP